MTIQRLSPIDIAALLADGPPAKIDDLKALVLEEIAEIQAKLRGDDLDTIRQFWTDDDAPRDENTCRDRLAGLLESRLERYGVNRITEADMPQSKRADLAFVCGSMQLPMEVKGQWHPELWNAAITQLDAQYTIDWRSAGRGLYCVLWFGDVPAKTGRRLTGSADGTPPPSDAVDLQRLLVEGLPAARRTAINIVVLDLSRKS